MFNALTRPLDGARASRRGAWRQQLVHEEFVDTSDKGLSKLASGLMLEWSDGILSGTRLWRHCHNAKVDGVTHPMVLRIAACWSEQTLYRCHSNIVSLLESCGIGQLITKVPGATLTTHCVLPSTYIRVMQSMYPHEFKLRLGADKRKLKEFWASFS